MATTCFPVERFVRFLDARTLRTAGRPLTNSRMDVTAMVFSADKRTPATANSNTITLWDVATRTPLGEPLRANVGRITAMTFSAAGRTLAAAGTDGTICVWERLLWRTQPELEGIVCRIVGDGLSRAEWRQYAPGLPYHRSCG